MFCFINLTPQTPPSVIHGWKATDLLYEMVKTEKYFFGPVKRQIFGDALKQTFYMISKLVIIIKCYSALFQRSLEFLCLRLYLSSFANILWKILGSRAFVAKLSMSRFTHSIQKVFAMKILLSGKFLLFLTLQVVVVIQVDQVVMVVQVDQVVKVDSHPSTLYKSSSNGMSAMGLRVETTLINLLQLQNQPQEARQ